MIAKESSSGCRYSVLLELEYFDSPRFLVVDPMHNLFLGTAKHHLKRVWIEYLMLNRFKRELMLLQYHLESVGSHTRLNQDSHLSLQPMAKLDNYFSLLAIADILGDGEHLECWCLFVLASRILCCKQLTRENPTCRCFINAVLL